MTHEDFIKAFGALSLAISNSGNNRSKTVVTAAEGYRKGTLGKKEDVKDLSYMTLRDLYTLSQDLKADERKASA